MNESGNTAQETMTGNESLSGAHSRLSDSGSPFNPPTEPAADSDAIGRQTPEASTSAEPSTADTPKASNKAGAPTNNRNRMRHGLRASQLPENCKFIENALNRLRREIEDTLGTTSILQAALIQSAMRHEKRALLCERWLRIHGDELPLAERLSLLSAASTATDSRDKCLDRLGLDRRELDPWANLNAQNYFPVHENPKP